MRVTHNVLIGGTDTIDYNHNYYSVDSDIYQSFSFLGCDAT
jgi:hypothetical protein